jgi:hypothetical protein
MPLQVYTSAKERGGDVNVGALGLLDVWQGRLDGVEDAEKIDADDGRKRVGGHACANG